MLKIFIIAADRTIANAAWMLITKLTFIFLDLSANLIVGLVTGLTVTLEDKHMPNSLQKRLKSTLPCLDNNRISFEFIKLYTLRS